MLRPLLYLSALITLAGAQQTFKASSEFDISSCPITIYGQTYQHAYVNLTSKNLVVCFNSFYSPGTKDDCIFGPLTDFDSAEFQKYQRIPILETIMKYSVPTIKTRMDQECYFSFSYQHNKGYATLALINFGPQTVLYVYSPAEGTVVVDVQVDGTSADQVEVTNTPTSRQTRGYLDISGCRHSGAVYKPATQVNSPETCFSLTCDEDVVLKTSSCGPLERCLGNGSCIPAVLYDAIFNPKLDLVCTVTGPALIDFQGHVTSVKDRCTYSLLSIPSVPGLQVLANFQERRRKDVSFLDSVTLWLDRLGVHIHLKQGGRVLVDDSTLTLSSSAQMVHGVELSQDLTGVTAKLSLSNFTVSVFFDGYTVQIHLEGPIGSALHGLCENSSRSLTELKLSESSSTSCEMQYTDTNDSAINCTRMTEHCNFLKEAPFSSCDIDPEPYITACTDTLCSYPDLDTLKCQFLEAYARTCRLKHNATLDGWRSKSECLNPEAFCQDRTCSDHEFCGEKTAGGDTRCFCRAIYASKYKDRNTLGDPTVCNQNSAFLTLVNCLLEDAGVDYTVLHLKDLTCRGHMDKERHMVTFSFNSTNHCGSEVTSNNNQIIYQNTISNDDGFSNVITRRDQVFIDFSCIYLQEATKAFKIRSSSVIKVITSAVWNYTLTMKAYTDAARTQPVESNTEVWLDQKIWVELKTDGLDGDLISMVTKSCWATNQESDNGSLRYDLIKNGCANPADPTVMVEGNGEGTSNYFSFNMFQFSGRSGNIFLHCKLQLCVKEGNSCIPKCNGARRRRSIRPRNEAPALISMVWTN